MPIPDPRFDRLLQGQSARPQGGNWLQKAGAVVVTLVVFALAMTFSVVLFAVVASIGLLVWGYLWWKTRDLRKAMREHVRAQQDTGGRTGGAPGPATTRGDVLEGEVIREVPDDEAPREGR
ncbi:MAG: CPBP family intramembrane metalloprotease [Rhodocyclaceae bacterium]|nr:CPBP family intramembrane metalloprotease [Rhodocyclaceae bacterium]